MGTKELIDKVTSLPVEERAIVLDFILKSLNPPDSEIDRKWVEVSKRRLADLQSGHVKSIPGNQVFDTIWKRFSK